MKRPESTKKFIVSVIFMTTLIIGCIIFIVGLKMNMLGNENPWLTFAGFCLAGTSTMVLCAGMGDLFKIFFTTIFGRNK